MNRIARTLFLLLAAGLVVPPLSAQLAGEHPVSTPVYAPIVNVGQAAIASDGDRFLAVWSDQRDRGAVYAARIARNGTVLDPHGILLANINSVVAAVWTGDRYLVVWNVVNSIAAAELDADGRLLSPARP